MKFLKLLPCLLIFAIILAGCGGGGPVPDNQPVPSKIVITPGSPTVLLSKTQQFMAVLTDTAGNVIYTSFAWSVEQGTSLGNSITSNGLFTAGLTLGDCTVVCSARGITARAKVTVTTTAIVIIPESTSLRPGGTQQFSAQMIQYPNSIIPASFTWSVEPAGSGTITTDGLFTAGLTSGPCTVVCSANDIISQACVNIIQPKIVITPQSAAILSGATEQFRADLTDSAGNVITTSITWSIEPGTSSGTISSDGLFTASTTPGQCTVVCSAMGVTARAKVDIVDKLGDAGKQLVADTDTVWGSLDAVNKINSLTESITSDFVPVPALNLFRNFGQYAFPETIYLGLIVRKTPSSYSFDQIVEQIKNGPYPNNVPYSTGTWTITFSEGWKTVVTRNPDLDDKAQFDYHVYANEELQFHGKFSFLATDLNPMSVSPQEGDPYHFLLNVECYQVEGADPLVQSASFIGQEDVRGNWDVVTYDYGSYAHPIQESQVFNGNVNFAFTNGNYFRFNGDWSIKTAAGTTDYMKGTLETADLTVATGRIEASNYQKDKRNLYLVPNTVSITDATIILEKNTPAPLTLNGSMNVHVINLASFDCSREETASNYPCGSLDFSGSIATGQNQISSSLHLERSAFQSGSFTIHYILNNAGTIRNFTFGASTSDCAKYQLTITSDWGPAAIEALIEFNKAGQLIKVTNGVVKANNNQIGTLSLEGSLLKVTYNNGEYETF